MNPDLLLTNCLRAAPWGAQVTRILAAALGAVDPAAAVQRYLYRDGDMLHAGDQSYDLRSYQRVFVVGTGKAGAPMARAAAELLGDRLAGGVVVVKGYDDAGIEHEELKMQKELRLARFSILNSQFSIVPAGHPIPDARGVAGARQIAQILEQSTARDLVIALISGGGSALLTLPADGISLDELQKLTNILLRCGATINEINTLRKHLDQVKGGGLARLAYPATMITLILSDVVGSPLDVIGSGPTVPDTSSFADAYAVLERYGVVADTPAPIVERLRRGMAGQIAETLKPGDPCFAQVHNLIIGSNLQAADAALVAARNAGFNTLLLTTYLQAEAREACR
jgi:glycerate 2-kinase